MYSLYVDHERKICDIGKAPENEEWLKGRISGNEIYRYSLGIYLCREKEPLVDFAQETREAWIRKLEKSLDDLKKSKITDGKFNIIWNLS